jgi:hypothetical protein
VFFLQASYKNLLWFVLFVHAQVVKRKRNITFKVLIVAPSIFVLSVARQRTNAQGCCKLLLHSSNYPDMFRQLTAIFRWLHVPRKLLQYCLRLGWMRIMVLSVWPAAAECSWPHRVTWCVGSTHNTPIHNILSTAPQLSISQKALETLLENGNVMPKHVGATIHN